jgi:hypothetical protein
MAKLKKGIFGPISGKLGPVVGGTWNGISYLREAPKKKAVPSPRSSAQIANEQKMKFVNDLLVPFHPYVTIGFQNESLGKTAISVAYSVNFHNAVLGVYPNLDVDYSKMVISVGPLPGLNQPVMQLSAPDIIEVTWQQNSNRKASFDDQVMLVLYSPALKMADGFTGGAKRTAKQCLFRFDQQLIGRELEVYISVTSLDRKKIANSIYMGRIVP